MADLSPAAQAVYDAAHVADSMSAASLADAMAAALRAAADHIDHDWSAFNCVDALYEIAAELDNSAQQ
jgi:hypothetical protein